MAHSEKDNDHPWPVLGGKDTSRIMLQKPEDLREAATVLVSQGRRFMRLYSPDLEHDVYDNPQFADAVSQLARISRFSEIRLLILDSRLIVQRGHCLLDLSRRLPSTISIRILTTWPDDIKGSFLLVDNCGILQRPEESEDPGCVYFNNRVLTEKYSLRFDELWYRATTDPELRALSL